MAGSVLCVSFSVLTLLIGYSKDSWSMKTYRYHTSPKVLYWNKQRKNTEEEVADHTETTIKMMVNGIVSVSSSIMLTSNAVQTHRQLLERVSRAVSCVCNWQHSAPHYNITN